MKFITFSLRPDEEQALAALCKRTLRDPRAQVKLIVINTLIDQGLLKSEERSPQVEHAARDK